MRDRTLTVVANTVKDGRCRYCHDPILWATTASQPRRIARTLPFNRPRPYPLRTERNDEIGLVFEVWPSAALHFTTCKHKPAKPKRPAIAPAGPVRHARAKVPTLFDAITEAR